MASRPFFFAQVARLGLAVACAEFALNAPCEVFFRRGLHVGLNLFAKQLCELRGVLRLLKAALFPVQTNLGIALAMRDAGHAQVHAHLGALAVEIGLQLIEDELLVLVGDGLVVLHGFGVDAIFVLSGERLLTLRAS